MNKKIFTLLAGAFMGFAAVSSVTAQIALEQQQLRVKPYDNAKPTLKFKEGANDPELSRSTALGQYEEG